MEKKDGAEEASLAPGDTFDNFEFKHQYNEGKKDVSLSSERRKAEYQKIKEKYPRRIPVVVEKHKHKHSQDLPNIDQNK